MSGWVGFDLDSTLAHYDQWRGIDHIGDPIPSMVLLLQAHLAAGREVRIFTARVGTTKDDRDPEEARRHIEEWCLKHIGVVLPVTNMKDFGMIKLYDDRCVQVEPNTGVILGRE